MNCVGVFDVLTFDNSQTNHLALMPQYQVLPMSRVVPSVESHLSNLQNVRCFSKFDLDYCNVCFCYVASRPSVTGQGGAGVGV